MAIRVGLVQINAEFSGQCYFPYSAGLLQAFAQRHLPDRDNYEFLLPVFRRERVADAVAQLKSADIVGFSMYCWNERLSMAIAERLKHERPSTLIVCGGPQVPRRDRPWEVEAFHKKYPFVDLAVHEAGEGAFLEVLQHGLTGRWEVIPSASYLGQSGILVQTDRYPGFKDLFEVPEPYLAGTFDPLITEHPAMQWIGLQETNRNCPFQCTFCGWGLLGAKPILRSDEEVYQVIDWFAGHRVKYIFVCDANFGIFRERDVAIARYLAKTKRERGFPWSVNVQDGKNIEEWVWRVRQELIAGGIESPAAIALQSLHPPTLRAIKRQNIKLGSYHANQQRYAAASIPTVTDLILGLPEETYESFTKGVAEVIRRGQHNRIVFNNCAMVPDAEMSHQDYRKEYGLKTVWMRVVNIHGFMESEEVPEMQELIIGTRTMPVEDWVRVRAFAWMASLLHCDKLLQIPFVICHEVGSTGAGRPDYDELINLFVSPELDRARFPLIVEIRDFFVAKARAIQGGDVEYCHAPQWLDVYWPADEFIFIKLVAGNKLGRLYAEAEELLADHVVIDPNLLKQAIALNRALLKLPLRSGKKVVECDWDIFGAYRDVLVGRFNGLTSGRHRYRIDWDSASWDSWEQWFREVVWWCNRGADYFLKPSAVVTERIP